MDNKKCAFTVLPVSWVLTGYHIWYDSLVT